MKKTFALRQLLQLTDDHLVASGSERLCYRVPGCTELCVKVARGHGRENRQNEKDYAYYTRLAGRGISWQRLARCHGWVRTDQGEGLVFDFITDPNGEPSMMLEHYLAHYGLSDGLREELDRLKAYLVENNIITCDLKEKNILCQRQGDDLTLKVVDGVGNRDFLKFADWSHAVGKRKIERHWKRLEERLRRIRYPTVADSH